jgi:hypothetical protein
MPVESVPVALRDRMITEFRQFLCEKIDFIPFEHQAAWWATTDGETLLDRVADPDEPGRLVRLPDETLERRAVAPRVTGRARVVAELGAYKSGKSAGAGIWAAAFGAVPEARVYLVGNEYDMCAPEFEYLLDALCSERGLNQRYRSLQNRPKDGRMWLELDNGARFEARRQGYAVFPTTPDRPWVGLFHDHGHDASAFPDWACHCGVPATVNPYSFDQAAMDRDEQLLTKEKFSIAYYGKLGDFVGRVYAYQRGDRQITLNDQPRLWHTPERGDVRENFRLPHDWRVEVGADTGTYCAAVVVAVSPEGDAYVLDELTNYRYVAHTPELDSESSLIRWIDGVRRMSALWKARPAAWVDSNSQFKAECAHHGLHLVANHRGREVRTEAARQYFQHHKIWLAPWLSILPYELEQAQWPEKTSAAGKYERIKMADHALDCLEHVLSRHPRAQGPQAPPVFAGSPGTVQWMGSPLRKRAKRAPADSHLGRD